MKKTVIQTLATLFLAVTLAACGSSKAVQGGEKAADTRENGGKTEVKDIDFLRQVSDNAVYSKNIVSPINFSLSAQGRNISVSGKLQMRRNEVIRITLTPLGLMEAGRIEFAPDYVLVVDRINRQYVKATYSDVDFLKNSGLDFYTLQSLFWNELFIPSKKAVQDSDLSAFTVDMQARQNRPITLKNGSLDFLWTTDVERKQITHTAITYRKGTAQESKASFAYSAFMPMGIKKFPTKEVLTFDSDAAGTGKIVLDMELNRISDDAGWDAKTTVSARYTQVSAHDVLSKLMGH